MCSNYAPARSETLARFGLPPPDFPYGEAWPTTIAPVLTNFAPREWLPAAFGLIPNWANDASFGRRTYNARSETVAEKPSFRDAWRARRFCVIPADAIYEPNWETGKAVRWRIERKDGQAFGIAGLWTRRMQDDGLPRWSMTMLTINSGDHPIMRHFHKPTDEKRSVVILADEDWGAWLGARSERDARALLQLFDPEPMRAVPDPRAPAPRDPAA